MNKRNKQNIISVFLFLSVSLFLAGYFFTVDAAVNPICWHNVHIYYNSNQAGKIIYSVIGLDGGSEFILSSENFEYIKAVIAKLSTINFKYQQCDQDTNPSDYPDNSSGNEDSLPPNPAPDPQLPPPVQDKIEPGDMPMPEPLIPSTTEIEVPQSPLVKTESYSSINKSETDFALRGIVYSNDKYKDFQYWFEFWSINNPLVVSSTKPGFRSSEGYFEQNVRIERGKIYKFRAVAQKAAGGGIAYGQEISFPYEAPEVVTEDYFFDYSGQKATFRASVWGKQLPQQYQTYFFWYPAKQPMNFSVTPYKNKEGNGMFEETISLTGAKNNIFCFKPLAIRAQTGIAGVGAVLCFPGLPLIATDNPSEISSQGAKLNGRAAFGESGNYSLKFLWGRRNQGFTQEITLGEKNRNVSVFYKLGNLAPSTEYCYRLVGERVINGENWKNEGAVKCFRTASAQTTIGCSNKIIDSQPPTLKVVVQLAKDMAKKVKIRPAFLIAIFSQETDIGREKGGCYLDADQRHIYPSNGSCNNIVKLKEIAQKFSLDYKKIPFSCCRYECGGAIGFFQFLPCVWAGYENAARSITDHNTPSPWNLCDSMAAAASKLSSDGASSLDRRGEIKASARYFGCEWWDYDQCLYTRQVLARAECLQEFADTGKMDKTVSYSGSNGKLTFRKCKDWILGNDMVYGAPKLQHYFR